MTTPKITTVDNVKVTDLPREWIKGLGLDPDEEVRVTIESRREDRRFDMEKVKAFLAKVHAMPLLDDRTPDEIIGYNAAGVPE